MIRKRSSSSIFKHLYFTRYEAEAEEVEESEEPESDHNDEDDEEGEDDSDKSDFPGRDCIY